MKAILEGGHSCPPCAKQRSLDEDATAASSCKRCEAMRRRPSVVKQRGGYILFETIIAMMVLSIGIIVVNNAIRQAVITRGLARDHTQACFLLEQTVSKLEMTPKLIEGASSGQFNGDHARFHWTHTVSRVDLPKPTTPPTPGAPPHELAVPYMTKIQVTVSWTRNGQAYQETLETLWGPEKLWVPGSI